MPFNGSGVYTPEYNFEEDAISADHFNVEAARVQGQFEDIAIALSTCLLKNGTQQPTANLPMNGKRHIGVDDAEALQEYLTFGQSRRNAALWCGTAGGTANALTLSPAVVSTGFAPGVEVIFASTVENTGPVTLKLNGLAAKNLIADDEPLQPAQIRIGRIYRAIYDGADFHLINASRPKFSNFTPALKASIGTPTVSGGISGRWRRIEDTVEGYILYDAVTISGTGSGVASIELPGLPEAISSENFRKTAHVSLYSSMILSVGSILSARVENLSGVTKISLMEKNSTQTEYLAFSALSNSFSLQIDFSYERA